jgi:hypothetical protein
VPADTLLLAGVLLSNVSGKKRISTEGYSVTDDEFQYLRALCDGSKRLTDVAVKLSSNLSEGPHRAEIVADRLAYLAEYEGTAHFIKHHGDMFMLTESGQAILC